MSPLYAVLYAIQCADSYWSGVKDASLVALSLIALASIVWGFVRWHR
jgi:hypothetical protein